MLGAIHTRNVKLLVIRMEKICKLRTLKSVQQSSRQCKRKKRQEPAHRRLRLWPLVGNSAGCKR